MQQLTASSFELASCQASVFTPDGGFSAAKIVKLFYPQQESLFDANPTVLPVPEDAPFEIPRVILESASHEWKCQLSPARADVIWARTKSTQTKLQLGEFFQKAGDILIQYTGVLGTRIARAAGLATRFAEHEEPGKFLARHFCQTRWDEKPLNRPENFELHAHKKFLLAGEFQVNSWVRNKTGVLAGEGAQRPILLFEQDINTLAETVADKSFQNDEIIRFLAAVAAEVDVILRYYFPEPR
ncbi:MAG: hypothetical protein V1790_18835 [Planctomycetota bacterium]